MISLSTYQSSLLTTLVTVSFAGRRDVSGTIRTGKKMYRARDVSGKGISKAIPMKLNICQLLQIQLISVFYRNCPLGERSRLHYLLGLLEGLVERIFPYHPLTRLLAVVEMGSVDGFSNKVEDLVFMDIRINTWSGNPQLKVSKGVAGRAGNRHSADQIDLEAVDSEVLAIVEWSSSSSL